MSANLGSDLRKADVLQGRHHLNDKVSLLRGGDRLLGLEGDIVNAVLDRDITLGADIDGTLVHAEPGEHRNVPPDLTLTNLFNSWYVATNKQAYMLTGRPQEFVNNVFPGREFLIGTEHGAVISLHHEHDEFSRIGDPEQMTAFRHAFRTAQQGDSLLRDVQIEKYKTSTATLGFTHIINPEGISVISNDNMKLMARISDAVHTLSSKILKDIGADDMQVVDTVTPTNAVIEIIPQGACKAESFQYLRDKDFIRKTGVNVFSGDSGGDLTIMTKVFNEKGGICLGVGPKAPECSHVVFERPEHHRAFLAHVLQVASNESPDIKHVLNQRPTRRLG